MIIRCPFLKAHLRAQISVPADITQDGVGEFRALHEKYKFAPRHTASQLSALATAKIFVEALTRSGKDLSREKLIKTLEGFYEYETGTTPRINLWPQPPSRRRRRPHRVCRGSEQGIRQRERLG